MSDSDEPYEGCKFLESEYLYDRRNAIITKDRFKEKSRHGKDIAGLKLDTIAEEEAFVQNFTLYSAQKISNTQLIEDTSRTAVKEALEKEREAAGEIYWKEDDIVKDYLVKTILVNNGKNLFDRVANPEATKRDGKLLEEIIKLIDFKSNEDCPENLKNARASQKVINKYAKTIFQNWASDRRSSIKRSLITNKKKTYTKFVEALVKNQLTSAVVNNMQDVLSTMEKTKRAIYFYILKNLIDPLKDLGIDSFRMKITDPVGHALMRFADDMLTEAKLDALNESLKDLKNNLKKKIPE